MAMETLIRTRGASGDLLANTVHRAYRVTERLVDDLSEMAVHDHSTNTRNELRW